MKLTRFFGAFAIAASLMVGYALASVPFDQKPDDHFVLVTPDESPGHFFMSNDFMRSSQPLDKSSFSNFQELRSIEKALIIRPADLPRHNLLC